MYKRYYDGYGVHPDCRPRGEVITPKCAEEPREDCACDENPCNVCDDSTGRQDCNDRCECEVHRECNPPARGQTRKSRGGNIFDNIEIDDIILLAVIVIMLKEGVEDSTLILVLGAIFLFGFID